MDQMSQDDEGAYGCFLMFLFFGFSYGFQQIVLILFEKNITYWQSAGICFVLFVIMGFIKGK